MGPIDMCPPPEEQTYPNIGARLAAAGLSWAWYNEGWNAVKPWAYNLLDGLNFQQKPRAPALG